MNKSTLYITYDGLTDPLGKAQIIPYLISISQHPRKLIVLSFEKKELSFKINSTKKILDSYNIIWVHLNFSNKFKIISKIIDLIKILFLSFYLTIRHKVKIIHGRGSLPSFYGYLIKKIFNLKLIFDCRGLWADERVDNNSWDLNRKIYNFIYKLFKKIENLLFRNSDAIIVLTNNIVSYLDIKYNKISDNIFSIPCCVDYEVFNENLSFDKVKFMNDEFGISDYQYIFYYSGSLGGIYQLEKMLDFFKVINNSFPKTYFLFFTPNIKILQKELLKKKYDTCKNNIKFKNLDRKDLPKFISLCDMMIYFIKPTFSKRASCPTKLGESLSLGVPIITNSGIGDIDQIFEKIKPGFLFQDLNNVNFQNFIKYIEEIKEINGSDLRDRSKFFFDIKIANRLYKKVYAKIG